MAQWMPRALENEGHKFVSMQYAVSGGGFETRARAGTVDLPCATVTDCARAVLMPIHELPPQTPRSSANEPATQQPKMNEPRPLTIPILPIHPIDARRLLRRPHQGLRKLRTSQHRTDFCAPRTRQGECRDGRDKDPECEESEDAGLADACTGVGGLSEEDEDGRDEGGEGEEAAANGEDRAAADDVCVVAYQSATS